jgi:signal transduction histidine kinase
VLGLRLAAAAAVAGHELNGVRAAAGDRLDRIDRALGVPEVRRLRRQELRLRDRLALLVALATAALAALLPLLRGGPEGRRRPWSPDAAGATVPGLARDEPDPHRRRGLLGAGHLATRLRRVAETQLAMTGPEPVGRPTGPEPAGRWTGPVPMALVLRAAAAEAESQEGSGRRVDLLTAGEVEVAGPAVVDLVHLLAELLDNAAAFSPPAAPVVVTAAGDGDGHLIEVTDRGLGMTGAELAWANQRLAGGTATDPAGPAAGDRLGLLIVARLAARNGFGVRLDRSPTGGVTAAVRVPAGLLSTRAPTPA